MRRYKKHHWMSFEKNPDFQSSTDRFHYMIDFWELKSMYNKGEILSYASNEYMTYSELFFENVMRPIVEEFFHPDDQRFKQFLRVLSHAIITGMFNNLVYKNEENFETAIQHEVEKRVAVEIEKEKKRLLDELIQIDDMEIPDAGFYHEYEKKRDEMEKREKDMYYKEKDLHYERKEMEVVNFKIELERKSMDIQKQLVELIKATNLQELNKKELEFAKQILDTQTRDLENLQKMNDLEGKIWMLQKHIKEQEVNHTINELTAFRRFLALSKERDIQDIDMWEIKSKKAVDDYIVKEAEELDKLLKEKRTVMQYIENSRNW